MSLQKNIPDLFIGPATINKNKVMFDVSSVIIVPTPVSDTEVTNKIYVDTLVKKQISRIDAILEHSNITDLSLNTLTNSLYTETNTETTNRINSDAVLQGEINALKTQLSSFTSQITKITKLLTDDKAANSSYHHELLEKIDSLFLYFFHTTSSNVYIDANNQIQFTYGNPPISPKIPTIPTSPTSPTVEPIKL
jgi:hypothetical protein